MAPIAAGGWYGYHWYEAKYHPADYPGPGTGSVLVQVKAGDTAFSLGPELVRLGVVESPRAFELAAEHATTSTGLEPGFFRLRKRMKATVAYAILTNPKELVQLKVTIPEGFRLSAIVDRLATADPKLTKSQLQQALTSAHLGLPSYAGKGSGIRFRAEGYLYPDTYQIQPDATALSVLRAMTKSFSAEATRTGLASGAAKLHLSPAQLVTVASLVQAEGKRATDYPKIARVIYNRLASGMKLGLDSTVVYGLGITGEPTSKQLAKDTPYNTYLRKGLPPGPIDNPGNQAIEAALHPAAGNWTYFVTVNPSTGLTKFTSSYAQFQQYVAELRKNTQQKG